MKWFIGVLLTSMMTLTVGAVQVGDRSPEIATQDQDGKTWKLSEELGEKHLVVYFYPAAMTGGCTKQACAYRDYNQGTDSAFEVVGISGDPVQNLKWFQQSEKLNFPLLSDADGAIAEAFGVPVKAGDKSITRAVDGNEVVLSRSATISRWTFIIDPKGTIVYRAEQVNPVSDLESVLAFLASKK